MIHVGKYHMILYYSLYCIDYGYFIGYYRLNGIQKSQTLPSKVFSAVSSDSKVHAPPQKVG